MIRSTDAREYEDLQIHPAANIWPLLEDDEFDDFLEDVRTKGILEPIKLYNGQIIDGRNRYKAFVITKTPPNFEDVTAVVDEVGGPKEYVLSLDKRRHMEKSQRAMCAARLLDYEKGEAKKRQQESARAVASRPRGDSGHFQGGSGDSQQTDTSGGSALKVAGKRLGVSHDSVHKAAKILKSGAPEVVKAVDAGKVSVGAAVKIAELPVEEQPAAIKEAVERKPAKEAGKSRLTESYWDEARGVLDKVGPILDKALSICEQAAARNMVGGSQQYRSVKEQHKATEEAVKRFVRCIDSLERKSKNK